MEAIETFLMQRHLSLQSHLIILKENASSFQPFFKKTQLGGVSGATDKYIH